MKKLPQIPSFAKGLLVAFPIGFLLGRRMAYQYQTLNLVLVAILVLSLSLSLDGIRERGFGPLLRSLPRIASVLIGACCIYAAVQGLFDLHRSEPSTLRAEVILGEVTHAFWLFVAVRSFIASSRPYPSVLAAFVVFILYRWAIPYAVLSDRIVIHSALFIYAVFSVRMIYADLVSVGIDLGQGKKVESGRRR